MNDIFREELRTQAQHLLSGYETGSAMFFASAGQTMLAKGHFATVPAADRFAGLHQRGGEALACFSEKEHQMALDYVAQRCGVTSSAEAVIKALQRCRLPASAEELRQIVADSLQMPASDLQPDDNLLDWGLDSIRVMSLLEGWRRAGADLSFAALAEQPTLAAWWALLAGVALD